MTIQGGGGGRNVPPGGPAKPASAERTQVTSSTTSKPPSAPVTTSVPTPPSATARSTKDGFDGGKPVDPRLASERAALPPSIEQASNSGIESTIRLLEARRDEILDDHRALRQQAWKLVGELAKGGFERTALDQRRNEMAELRQRLAQQRRRLQQIKRRLKTAMARSSKHGDVDVSKTIQAHLDKMKKLEPGVQKTLHALVAMEQAFAGALDAGGRPVASTTHAPEPPETAAERGGALARVVPGAVVAVGVAQLFGHAAGASSPAASTSSSTGAATTAPTDSTVRGLQAFAEQLLSAL